MLRTVPSRSIAKNMIARSARYTTDPWARPRRTKQHDRSLRSLQIMIRSSLILIRSFIFIYISIPDHILLITSLSVLFFGQYL